MKRKDFDCVEMKEKIQEEILHEQSDWTIEKTIEYYDTIYKEMISKKRISDRKDIIKKKIPRLFE